MKDLFDQQFDWKDEWHDMPEFAQDNLNPYRVINVRFRNNEDVSKFAELMGQKITPNQKTIWFPKAEFRRRAHLRYIDES